MPLHADLLITIAAILFGISIVTAAAFLLGAVAVRVLPWWPLRGKETGAHVHCRYCYFGRAYAREESVRVEDDDLVEVTCFVCRTCSLPQWRVQRSPVLKRAA
jgi:hypothetical protein